MTYTNCKFYSTAEIAVDGIADLPKGTCVGVRYIGHRWNQVTGRHDAVYEIRSSKIVASYVDGFYGHLFDTALTRFVF